MPDADPFDNLPALDLDAQPFFDEPPEARNAGAGLADDRKLITTTDKQRFIGMEQARRAADTLERLPRPNETFHIVCSGMWPAWSLIPAIMELSGATIERLYIATLGFSKGNAEELLTLHDAKQIGEIAMLISCYFRSNEHEMVDALATALQARGQRFAAVRNHAKVTTMELSSGEYIAIETSANLRSCRNVEQFTITHSPELVAFHNDWINTILAGGDQK